MLGLFAELADWTIALCSGVMLPRATLLYEYAYAEVCKCDPDPAKGNKNTSSPPSAPRDCLQSSALHGSDTRSQSRCHLSEKCKIRVAHSQPLLSANLFQSGLEKRLHGPQFPKRFQSSLDKTPARPAIPKMLSKQFGKTPVNFPLLTYLRVVRRMCPLHLRTS